MHLIWIAARNDAPFLAYRGQCLVDAVVAQGGKKSERLPVVVRCFGPQPFSLAAATVRAGHIGLDPGFVDEKLDALDRLQADVFSRYLAHDPVNPVNTLIPS